jgi:hypothetical protein
MLAHYGAVAMPCRIRCHRSSEIVFFELSPEWRESDVIRAAGANHPSIIISSWTKGVKFFVEGGNLSDAGPLEAAGHRVWQPSAGNHT